MKANIIFSIHMSCVAVKLMRGYSSFAALRGGQPRAAFGAWESRYSSSSTSLIRYCVCGGWFEKVASSRWSLSEQMSGPS